MSGFFEPPPRYAPIAPLGKGGGGEVWSVRDRITGKVAALKALAEGAAEPEVLALVREATALSGVEGLGVPRVLRFGRLPNGRPYLVRELVEGQSLSDLLEHPGDPLAHLAAIADAADLVTRLHRALLLHGDLKPANIIVAPTGRATLVDLGLAANMRDGGAKPEGLTPRYAAPELFTGAPLTFRAEVYALGATLDVTISAIGDALPANVRVALAPVVARATALDPAARHPSADEFASALRSAAGLPERADEEQGAAWPVVGLDAPAAALLERVEALRAGGGIVVSGPKQSGRSTLLRRVAWSLGVRGAAVAWIEASVSARQAIDLELAAHPEVSDVIAIVDDADRLGDAELQTLEAVRHAGGKLVLCVGEAAEASLPGATFELFAVAPLSASDGADLVRRAIPSLGDAVIAHVIERTGGWPGRLRGLVAKLERAPVVAPEDVDALVEHDAPPPTSTEDIHRLLDRGHNDAAADALARHEGDATPAMVLARARLHGNRGDVAKSLGALDLIRDYVLDSGDPELEGMFRLTAARAFLRAGDYAQVESHTRAIADRLGLVVAEGALGKTRLSGVPSGGTIPPPGPNLDGRSRSVLSEALAVRGLAQSYAGDNARARATLDRSVAIARSLGEPRTLSLALGSLAFVLQRSDSLADAKIAYEGALACAEQAGDAGSVATTRLNLAGIAQSTGDLANAILHLEAAVDMGRRSGRVATLRQSLFNLANLELYLGRAARARTSLDALAADLDFLLPHQKAQLTALEAEHAARSGDLHRALELCREAADTYEAMGRGADAAEARLEGVLFAAGALDVDLDELARDVDLARRDLGDATAHRAQLGLAAAKLAALAGRTATAEEAIDGALEVARAAGQKDWIARALEARADLDAAAGRTHKAKSQREAALAVLEEIAQKLPSDLREVFWSEPRRHALRRAAQTSLVHGATVLSTSPSADMLARLLDINRAIAGEHDLGRLLRSVTDHAIALVRAERGFVILRSGYGSATEAPPGSSLSIHAVRDQSGDDPHARFSQSIAERVIRSGEPVVTASAREDARMADYLSVHQLMLQSIACVPIRSRSNDVIGALYLETRLRAAQTFEADVPTLLAVADQAAIAIETARLVGENERRANALETANQELLAARARLEELLGHRTAQLAATRRDLKTARRVLRGHFGYEGLVGTSEAMRRVYALVDRIKDTDVPVLLSGESGTGKEVVARAIHNAGARAKQAFVGINCGAIPEALLESELFGHVRGAFTGADRDRRGLFREASDGTILLDEIGEMPPRMQASLLRVLQERAVRAVGGAREEPVSTRVIAATHRDLASMVEHGTFREDLYYRLHVIEVRIPPLRERVEDLPILIDHFLGIFAARYNRERGSVSRTGLKHLQAYSWPGNVRQLENVLLNAWVLSDASELEPEDFELPGPRPRVEMPTAGAAGAAQAGRPPTATTLDAHRSDERQRIVDALTQCNWNRVKAAEIIGMPRRTFYRRLKEYGIQ